MTKIEALVFLHVLGAFLIVAGAGVGMASGIAMSQTDSVPAIERLSFISHRCERFVIEPGVLLTVVTGTWLIADYVWWSLDEFWLWGSYVLTAVAVALGEGVLAPQIRRVHKSGRTLAADGVERSAELQALAASRRLSVTGVTMQAILVVFLYLMVMRPGA